MLILPSTTFIFCSLKLPSVICCYYLQAINYVSQVNQTTSFLYPYTSGGSGVTGTCNSALINSLQPGQAVKLSGSALSISPTMNENALMQAVAAAPTVFYFDASLGFQFYGGGIYPASDCTSNINHASE